MSDQFLGEIRMVGWNFAAIGWIPCNGALLPISEYSALFSILGTSFGGNGTSTFGLPNLQGCVPMDFGQGSGLSDHALGETGGAATVGLNNSTMPSHTHPLNVVAQANGTAAPGGACPAEPFKQVGPVRKALNWYSSSAPNATLYPGMVAQVGGNQPHTNMQPYLALYFAIATSGVYPTRG